MPQSRFLRCAMFYASFSRMGTFDHEAMIRHSGGPSLQPGSSEPGIVRNGI